MTKIYVTGLENHKSSQNRLFSKQFNFLQVKILDINIHLLELIILLKIDKYKDKQPCLQDTLLIHFNKVCNAKSPHVVVCFTDFVLYM